LTGAPQRTAENRRNPQRSLASTVAPQRNNFIAIRRIEILKPLLKSA
jgi:hypothetical protein